MTAAFDFESKNYPVGGYRIELEDRESLFASDVRPHMLPVGDLPERVDPRSVPWYRDGWMMTENQGSIGSCAGNALTTCMEYCYGVETNGKVVQLSRMMAYLTSQMEDNIRGDSGSTLSGNTRAGMKGICREEIAPYPSRYPGWGWVTSEMREDGKNYQIQSHSVMKSSDDCKKYIGSGIGIVQIGISWNNSMTPDSNGCIKRWSSGGGGGHSVCLAGYVPDSDVGQRSSSGYWILLVNSWGRAWGKNGWAYVDPPVVDAMCRHSWSVLLGRSDMNAPSPRPLPVDFTKESLLG
jgi:hypothetical protein